VRDNLIPRWRGELAEEIPSITFQRWLVSLHNDKGLAWTTVSKIRGLANRIYRIGLRYGLVESNPVEHTESRCKSDYKAIIVTPPQTFTILEKLSGNPLHCALVITIAATGLRSSEALSLRWFDILWDEGEIRISKRWAKGKDGEPKTAASNGTVPLHPILTEYLKQWHARTAYGKPGDFVFPSIAREGKVPIWPSTFIADYLRPAAKAAGVRVADGQRLGLHNFRHSLATFLATTKTHPKVVQGLLRHADLKITLGLYTQEDSDEKQAAQGAFLAAMGLASPLVQ
jgi:integrase